LPVHTFIFNKLKANDPKLLRLQAFGPATENV
jgi:hypothetical protein